MLKKSVLLLMFAMCTSAAFAFGEDCCSKDGSGDTLDKAPECCKPKPSAKSGAAKQEKSAATETKSKDGGSTATAKQAK